MHLKSFAYLAFFVFQSLYCLTWMNDIDQALVVGVKEHKPILVYFAAPWNTWCQKLEAQVLTQSTFEKLASEMILAKLNFPKNSQNYTKNLARYKKTYQVYSYPTLLILSPVGKLLGSVGYPRDSVDEYIAKIRFLAGINDKPIQASKRDEKNLPFYQETKEVSPEPNSPLSLKDEKTMPTSLEESQAAPETPENRELPPTSLPVEASSSDLKTSTK